MLSKDVRLGQVVEVIKGVDFMYETNIIGTITSISRTDGVIDYLGIMVRFNNKTVEHLGRQVREHNYNPDCLRLIKDSEIDKVYGNTSRIKAQIEILEHVLYIKKRLPQKLFKGIINDLILELKENG